MIFFVTLNNRGEAAGCKNDCNPGTKSYKVYICMNFSLILRSTGEANPPCYETSRVMVKHPVILFIVKHNNRVLSPDEYGLNIGQVKRRIINGNESER